MKKKASMSVINGSLKYFLDKDNYLMDSDSNYILDSNGK